MNEELHSEKKKSFWGGLILGAVLVGIALTITFVVMYSGVEKEYEEAFKSYSNSIANNGLVTTNAVINQDFSEKVAAIYGKINQDFYFEDQIDEEKMRDEMFKAIFSSLDDVYSEYYTEEEFSKLNDDTQGIYYGIGSYVKMDSVKGYAYLAGVFNDSPASRAGLRDGDYIYKVEGQDMAGMTLTDVVALIKGPENTPVNITIVRGNDTLDVTVIRGKVTSPTVTYKMLEDGIGYIDIQEFDEVTTKQFTEAYEAIKAENAKALIIDLRSNGGGMLSTVLDICEQLLPKGVVTYTETKSGKKKEYYSSGKNEINIPLVVLTNGYTASASELMSGAIRDYKKGTLIGTTTFGKGIVQTIIPLNDGTAMKITTAKYFTPNGECIHKTGIAPDIELEFDSDLYYSSEVDNQIDYAVEYLKKQIK